MQRLVESCRLSRFELLFVHLFLGCIVRSTHRAGIARAGSCRGICWRWSQRYIGHGRRRCRCRSWPVIQVFVVVDVMSSFPHEFIEQPSVFLDAADVVLAKRRISDVATMLHLRQDVFVFMHLNILTDSPCFYPPYLQPRNFQTHFDEHRVGHPVQLSHDPPRRWHVLPKVRNTPASHVI
jgi:hypothetical protein